MRLTVLIMFIGMTAVPASVALAQTNEEPFEQFQWTVATPGATANAMGGASVATDNPAAPLTNPAALAGIDRYRLVWETCFLQE